VRVAFAGVNFYDTQQRSGLIARPLPIALGLEGAGTVVALGPGTRGVAPGDRVAWAQSPGSYATELVVPAEKLVPIPPAVTLEDAAAVLFQGLTAHHLACSTFPLEPGQWCLIHSAAGGVGGLLAQIARKRGAHVLAAVSTAAKADVARAAADEVHVYASGDVAETAKRVTGGRGVDVVYDAVGKDTFESSLAALRPRGMLAVYGEASGFIPPFDLRRLSALGSLFVTRTSLNSYLATREEYLARAGEVLAWVEDGTLRPRIHAIYPLAEAGEAHRALESRESVGKVLLRCE
jgi:NADPH2:quinone reductase